jgi:hypothetical protein
MVSAASILFAAYTIAVSALPTVTPTLPRNGGGMSTPGHIEDNVLRGI